MGKGGGALSMWIKEFTALVFTQTIQAFIYAIILSIILFGMSADNANGISADDNNAALGLMSVFALLSVFKVEEMSKKIFGISDTKAAPGSAVRNLTKLAIAGQLGKKVLNNTGKIFGGIKAVGQAGQDRRKAKKRLDEDMQDNGFAIGADGKPVPVGRSTKTSSGNRMTAAQKEYFDKAKAAKANGDMDGYRYNMGIAAGIGKSGGGSSGSSGGGSAGASDDVQMSDSAYRRVKNALRTYEDKASEINKARNEGIKNIISGLAESTGAVLGAAPGAVIGATLGGDIEDALTGMVSGAGIGDAIGKNAVEAVTRATQFVQRNYKREAGMSNRELQKAIQGYKDALSKANVNYNSSRVDVGDIED